MVGAVVAGPEVRAVLCIYTDRTVGGSRHGEHPRHSSIILEIFSPLNVNNVLITSSHPRNGSALRIRTAHTPSGHRLVRPRSGRSTAIRVCRYRSRREFSGLIITERNRSESQTQHAHMWSARWSSCAARHRYYTYDTGGRSLCHGRRRCACGHTSIPHTIRVAGLCAMAPSHGRRRCACGHTHSRKVSATCVPLLELRAHLKAVISSSAVIPMLAFPIYLRGQAESCPDSRSVVPWAASRVMGFEIFEIGHEVETRSRRGRTVRLRA